MMMMRVEDVWEASTPRSVRAVGYTDIMIFCVSFARLKGGGLSAGGSRQEKKRLSRVDSVTARPAAWQFGVSY